jgi:hypothetical protein
MDESAGLDATLLQDVISDLAGIESVRVNSAAASVVVQYQVDRFPPAIWETLLEGPESEAAQLIDTLVEAFLADAS